MPGTAGSLVAALPLPFIPSGLWPWAPIVGCVLATIACVAISRKLPEKGAGGDPGWFVLDEAAGLWLCAAILADPTWTGVGLAFLLFRVFDIAKPPPIRTLEKASAGFGIVLDDLAAGVYALALLYAWEIWGAF